MLGGSAARRLGGSADRHLFPRPTTPLGWLQAPLTWLSILLIRLYQLVISPGLPSSCRFAPSCSAYTLEAVQRHGALRGIWLGARRLDRAISHARGGQFPDPDA